MLPAYHSEAGKSKSRGVLLLPEFQQLSWELLQAMCNVYCAVSSVCLPWASQKQHFLQSNLQIRICVGKPGHPSYIVTEIVIRLLKATLSDWEWLSECLSSDTSAAAGVEARLAHARQQQRIHRKGTAAASNMLSPSRSAASSNSLRAALSRQPGLCMRVLWMLDTLADAPQPTP